MSERPSAYASLNESDQLAIDTSVILTYKVSRDRVLLSPAKATQVDLMRVMVMDAAIRGIAPAAASIVQLVTADISIRREQIAKTPQLLKESREKFLMAQINQALVPEDIANFIYQTPFVDMRSFIDQSKLSQASKFRMASVEAAAKKQGAAPTEDASTNHLQSAADDIMFSAIN